MEVFNLNSTFCSFGWRVQAFFVCCHPSFLICWANFNLTSTASENVEKLQTLHSCFSLSTSISRLGKCKHQTAPCFIIFFIHYLKSKWPWTSWNGQVDKGVFYLDGPRKKVKSFIIRDTCRDCFLSYILRGWFLGTHITQKMIRKKVFLFPLSVLLLRMLLSLWYVVPLMFNKK